MGWLGQGMTQKRKFNKQRKGKFIGAWVPERVARAAGRAVTVFGFADRAQFLRTVLEAAVEEIAVKERRN